jgi:hypothetical protein
LPALRLGSCTTNRHTHTNTHTTNTSIQTQANKRRLTQTHACLCIRLPPTHIHNHIRTHATLRGKHLVKIIRDHYTHTHIPNQKSNNQTGVCANPTLTWAAIVALMMQPEPGSSRVARGLHVGLWSEVVTRVMNGLSVVRLCSRIQEARPH